MTCAWWAGGGRCCAGGWGCSLCCSTAALGPRSSISSREGSSRPKPLSRRLSSAFSCRLGPWPGCLGAVVMRALLAAGVGVVTVPVLLATGAGLSVHREVLERPESLLAERAWSLWSGLEAAEVVRAPRPSVAPAATGLFLGAALSWPKP